MQVERKRNQTPRQIMPGALADTHLLIFLFFLNVFFISPSLGQTTARDAAVKMHFFHW